MLPNREDFPMLKNQMHGKPLVYLDSAATSQKPQIVIDTITDFYHHHYATVHRTIYQISSYATEAYEKSRVKVQQFLNAKYPEEIIFTRGTTEGINLVARSFGEAFIKPGDQIIVSEMEHHSNIVPWQMLCQRSGAQLKVIPFDTNGGLDLEKFQQLLTKNTKLVAVAHISNAAGALNPIKKITEMAHQYGAKVLIDGAQAVSHLKIDLQDLDVDFYVFSGHKMYGPTGIGVLYGKKELLDQMPPYQGGGDMVDQVSFEGTTYNALPLKFEAGTPIIAEVIGLGAAVDYLTAIGMPAIHQWENQLVEHLYALVADLPEVQVLSRSKEKGAILTFNVEGMHPFDIGTLLDLQGIAIRTGMMCAHPTMKHFGVPSACRASFGLYNTKEEIDFFVAELKKIISRFSSRC